MLDVECRISFREISNQKIETRNNQKIVPFGFHRRWRGRLLRVKMEKS